MIESVDSLHLAEDLNATAAKLARSMPILLQVNVAGESTKFGYNPDQLLADLERINALPRLAIHGLMTIAPFINVSERVRACFQRLRRLKEECESRLGVPLAHLSMGMSGDYEIAIEEGATLIRVGTSLLGKRLGNVRRET
jgi:pyridoxal phosphate enzyme (YggS family)